MRRVITPRNMESPTTDRELVAEVARRREAAQRHWARSRWIPAISLLAGIVVGLGFWFFQKPADRDDAEASFAVGVSGVMFLLLAFFGRILFPRPNSKCPRCACDWNSESNNDLETWLDWAHCPRCGLAMRGEVTGDEKPQQR